MIFFNASQRQRVQLNDDPRGACAFGEYFDVLKLNSDVLKKHRFNVSVCSKKQTPHSSDLRFYEEFVEGTVFPNKNQS